MHGHPSREGYYSSDNPIENNKHWIPWLRCELINNGIEAENPLMPNAYNPVYEDWKTYFEMFPVHKDTVLVGHSRGGAFLIRWLVETQQEVQGVFLIAPADEHKWGDRKVGEEKFSLPRNYSAKSSNIFIYVSDNDDVVSPDTGKEYAKNFGAKLRSVPERGHFTLSDMGTEEFPELLNDILTTVDT